MKKITVLILALLLCFALSPAQTYEKLQDMGQNVLFEKSPFTSRVTISPLEAIWDLQVSFNLEVATGALGNAGAGFDGTHFYSTRWASNLIHEFDLTGTLIREFSVTGVSGLRDLAYDGTYFYGGAASNTIYQMDFTTSTLIGTIASPVAVRHIAYDEVNDAFWVGNWSTDIVLVDRNGATLATIPATTHGFGGMYGTAYDGWSSGGPFLWVFDQGGGSGSPQLIHQIDLNTLTVTGVSYDVTTDFPTTAGIAGGLWTGTGVVPGKVSIGGVLQGTPDMYFSYELALAADPDDPNPPTNVAAYSDYLTPTDMALTWTDPTTLVNGTPINTSDFTIEIERDGAFLTSVAGGTGQYTDTGLNDGQQYEYGIYAKLVANDSTSSTVLTSWTAGGAGQPIPPAAFAITDPGTGQLRAYWTNPSHNIDGTPMDDFAAINLYEDGNLITTFTRTPADTGRADSADFTPSAGTHIDYITAVDNEVPPFESDASNSSVSLVPPIMTVAPLNITDTLLVNEIKVLNITISNNQIDPSSLHFIITEGPPSSWLIANPVSGTIPSNGQMSIEVTLDATALPTGPYVAELVVNGNDPNNPEDRVQINMRVNPAPIIDFDPDSMQFAVLINEADSAQMTIYNNGAGALEFELTDKDIGGENSPAMIVDRSYIRPEYNVDIPKGTADWRVGTPQTEGAGGPDQFGYSWIDSDEPGGASFNWIDISSTGTQVTGLSDDNHVGPFSLGFTFNFYGIDYTEFYVQSNGLINFDNSYISYSNQQIPLTGSYNNLLAWFWDDLNPSTGGTVYYQNLGNMLVVQFVNYPEYGGSGVTNAEVIMYANGTIKYQYQNFLNGMDLLGCTVGIENVDGTDGLQVVYNAPYLHDNLAIRFSAQSTWLSENPTSGTIPPGGNMDIWVTANSLGLLGGEYFANVIINSNDPLTPDTSMLVHMTVIGIPDISTNPDSLFFADSLFVGTSESKTLQIVNSGNGVLNVSNITSTNSVFTLDTTHFRVPPLQSFDVEVTFTPLVAGNFSGNLQISNNDPLVPLLEVPVEGGAIPAPEALITPNFQNPIPIYVNDSVDVSITIANTGGNPLEWSASARRGNRAPVNNAPEIHVSNYYPGKAANGSLSLAPPLLNVHPQEISPLENIMVDGLAYASDISIGQFIKFSLISPTDTSIIAPTAPAALVEADFNDEGIFYAIDVNSGALVSIDTSTGAITTIGAMQPATWTGLAYDPTSGIWYALSTDVSTTSTLYTIDPTNGATTMIGSTTDAPGIVGIAIDNSGNMYAHDILLNAIFSIDKATGATTQIGLTGITADIVYQDMDFDPATNILYLAAFNNTTGAELRMVDVVTGGTTLVGPIGTGTATIGAFAISGVYSSWIKLLEPTSGTVNPANQVDLQVRLYGIAEMRDTTLTATIEISTNDPLNPLVIVDVIVDVITGIKDQNIIPTEFTVFQNYPNPFNPSTTIKYQLPQSRDVTLQIYNVLGQKVRTLVNNKVEAGYHQAIWDGRNDIGNQVASGIYIYRFEAGDFQRTMKLMLLK